MEPKHPAFDSEEQEILSAIAPEDESVPEDGAGEAAAAEAPKPVEPSAAPTEAPKQDPDTQEEAASPEAAKPAAEEPESQQQPAQNHGDTRAALRAARREERRLRGENERLQQELEALRQGKAPVDTRITEDELAELERDFPLQAKVVRQQRALEEQLAARVAPSQQTQQQAEFQPVVYDPTVQEVIDSVPDLLNWQYDPNAQDKFQRAIEYDKALSADPDWRNRPANERFEEAARRTREAFAPAPSPSPSAAAAAPRLDPAKAIESAPVQGPKGISDFRGGAPASAPALDYTRMSDEAVMASLKPEA